MVLVYKYGLLDPVEGVERVEQQLLDAHRYQNKLVELEHVRRKAIDALVVTPELIAAYEVAKVAGKAAKAAGEAAKSADKAAKAAAETNKKELEKESKRLWAVVSAIRNERLEKYKKEIEQINRDHKVSCLAARKETETFWGTYLQIEKAAEAAAKASLKESGREAPNEPVYPHFRRWKRQGGVAVQIQKGMTLERLFSGEDTRLRLALEPIPVPGRKGKPRPRLSLRISSNEQRDPIWAIWPIIYHRPLPEGAVIKEAKVVRRMIASDARWHVVFTLELQNPVQENPPTKWVALDIGWRRTEEDLKSATRGGEWWDGANGKELILADEILKGLVKADDLRSIRAKHRLAIQASLLDWIKQVGKTNMPEAFVERIRYLANWQAEAQFAKLVLWWKDNRFAGDEAMFVPLEQWRKKDKHLWHWEAYQRKSSIYRRTDFYQCVAAELSKIYDGLIIENLNLAKLSQKEKRDDPGQHQSRAQKQSTAPSHLRTAMVNAFKREGKPISVVPAGHGAKALYQAWSEGKGTLMAAAPARSKRFKRLRKIVDPPADKPAGDQPPLA